MDNPLYIAMLTVAISAILLNFKVNQLRRRKATYKMYEARDTFVLLVANEIISEDSIFFKYYYKRLNTLLSHAPNIGIEHAFKSLLKYRNNVSFSKQLEKARSEHERVKNCKEMQTPEAREAAEFFYSATQEMILAHSSIVRLSYYLLSHVTSDFWHNLITNRLPRNLRGALALAKFSSDEAEQLRDRSYAH